MLITLITYNHCLNLLIFYSLFRQSVSVSNWARFLEIFLLITVKFSSRWNASAVLIPKIFRATIDTILCIMGQTLWSLPLKNFGFQYNTLDFFFKLLIAFCFLPMSHEEPRMYNDNLSCSALWVKPKCTACKLTMTTIDYNFYNFKEPASHLWGSIEGSISIDLSATRVGAGAEGNNLWCSPAPSLPRVWGSREGSDTHNVVRSIASSLTGDT